MASKARLWVRVTLLVYTLCVFPSLYAQLSKLWKLFEEEEKEAFSSLLFELVSAFFLESDEEALARGLPSDDFSLVVSKLGTCFAYLCFYSEEGLALMLNFLAPYLHLPSSSSFLNLLF